ncbi:MAG: magnesium transporter CorA family protein [Labedaea sp.]
MASTRLYRDGVLVAEDFPVSEVSEHLRDSAATIWVDLCAPTEEDVADIRDELGLHRLAIEDAVLEDHQRPKLDHYDTHLFLVAYAVRMPAKTGTLATTELAAFITERALVTVRKNDQFDMAPVVRRWDAASGLAKAGVPFLLHGLLDHVVDGHFDAAQALDDRIEALEEAVFDDHVDRHTTQRGLLRLRRSLLKLRHVVLPMREVVNSLMVREHDLVNDEMMPYYQDVYDHVLRATEWTETLRELISSIRETQLSVQSNRLNTIMKKVTSWAAIIAVPTAVTGFYGQNLPYPGFEQTWGVWTSTALIVILSVALYRTFKRHDWL